MDLERELNAFLERLHGAFPGRVAFFGLQGSRGRGEAGPHSDVDLVTVLDRVGRAELAAYRALVGAASFGAPTCGFLCGRDTLAAWPGYDALQLLLDTRPLYGALAPLLPPIGPGDVAGAVQAGCAGLYHAACHACVFEEDTAGALDALRKSAFFVLRMEHYRRSGRYAARRADLLPLLEPEERALLEPGGDPDGACAALMRWAGAHMAVE